MQERVSILRKGYVLLVSMLVVLIVFTPHLIGEGFSIFSEEFLEGSIIFMLLVVGLVIDFVYTRELRKQDTLLQEAWKHIGVVNLLVERFRTVLTDDKEYPRTKKELRSFAESVFEKVRGVIPCDFLILRVVETETLKTIFEYSDHNVESGEGLPHVSNKDLVRGREVEPWGIICSQSSQVKVRAFLIFPNVPMGEDRKTLIQKIINDFATVYVVSSYIL